MSAHRYITLNNVGYKIEEKILFQNVTLSFGKSKYGLVGRNGIGKSSLIKLIMGELTTTNGKIHHQGTIFYCPQEFDQLLSGKISTLLGIEEKLNALKRIQEGSINEHDYDLVDGDWQIKEYMEHQLHKFGLRNLTLERSFNTLSGGEKTRFILAKAFLLRPDFIIFDEPTNNLDLDAREALYEAVRLWQGGLLIVSHDRALLGLMDEIIEISTLGIRQYGGNYETFIVQKKAEQEAAQQAIRSSEQILKEARQTVQIRKERHEQARAKGRRAQKTEIAAKGRISTFLASQSKERSERTQRRIQLQATRKLSAIESKLDEAKKRTETDLTLDIALPNTSIPSNKIILTIKNLTYQYPIDTIPIIKNFSFQIHGPERIAIYGPNGSGKTTLLKLIQNELLPEQGEVRIGVERYCYIDQHVKILNPNLTILDNYLLSNPDDTELEARSNLAHFLFRNQFALKKVSCLSSGERLRAALACLLLAKLPPQLLILDEPTNHLDLSSITNIESALKHYQGAILIVSHDKSFLDNLEISRILKAPFIGKA